MNTLGAGLATLALALTGCTTADDRPVPHGEVRLSCDDDAPPAESLPEAGEVTGAVLCSAQPQRYPWYAPPDGLTEGLNGVQAVIAGLEVQPDDYRCFGDTHTPYDLRLAVDGRMVSFRTDLRTCGSIEVGGVDYSADPELLDTVLEAIESQRDGRRPPATNPGPVLDCDAGPTDDVLPTSLIGDPLDMVEAVSCWRPDAEVVGPRRQAVVSADDLAVLVADVRAGSRKSQGTDWPLCPGDLYYQDLLGRTAWGDVVSMSGTCTTFVVRATGDPDWPAETWIPSPEAQRILDGLRR